MFDEAAQDLWVGVPAAAQLTGRDRTTIFRARKSGRLPVWAGVGGMEAIRLADLTRLYPPASWPDSSDSVVRRHLLAGPFEPAPEPPDALQGDIHQAAIQAIERLAAEKIGGRRLLYWAGALSMILVAISNFFIVAALARLSGLF